MTSTAISIPELVAKLSEEDQARFYDTAYAGLATPVDIVEKLRKLDEETRRG